MAIKHWPNGEGPREKLAARGAGALSEAELLAIIMRTGVKGKSAVDLGRELLQRFGSLSSLLAADLPRLQEVSGLGFAKAATLNAVIELLRRALKENMHSRTNANSPHAVRDYLRLALSRTDKEVFLGIFLDAQNHVLGSEVLSEGTLTQTSVFPREVVKRALYHDAAAMIFAQNSKCIGMLLILRIDLLSGARHGGNVGGISPKLPLEVPNTNQMDTESRFVLSA